MLVAGSGLLSELTVPLGVGFSVPQTMRVGTELCECFGSQALTRPRLADQLLSTVVPKLGEWVRFGGFMRPGHSMHLTVWRLGWQDLVGSFGGPTTLVSPAVHLTCVCYPLLMSVEIVHAVGQDLIC